MARIAYAEHNAPNVSARTSHLLSKKIHWPLNTFADDSILPVPENLTIAIEEQDHRDLDRRPTGSSRSAARREPTCLTPANVAASVAFSIIDRSIAATSEKAAQTRAIVAVRSSL
jgi:hypothetical protein